MLFGANKNLSGKAVTQSSRREAIIRPVRDVLPDIALPVYLRGVGYHCFRSPYQEYAVPGEKMFVQIFWGIAGTGKFVFDDGKHCVLGANTVVCRLPGETHHLEFDGFGEWSYRWLTFDGPGAADFIRSYRFDPHGFTADACPHELFLEAGKLLQDRTPYAWRQTVAVIAAILARAGGGHDNSGGEGKLVKAFVDLCRNHANDGSVNVNVIADMLEIDRSTLRRAVKRQLRTTPGTYLREMRIQQALTLLQTTDLPVAEIADQTGFINLSHFCRSIREVTGRPPGAYRGGKH